MSRLATLLALLVAPALSAQTLTVTSTTPSDYQAGVPLQASLSFTFSEPLADLSEPLAVAPQPVILPADSAQVGGFTQSADRRTLTFPVTHTANTRFVVLLLGATSATGDQLARPVALNYTTAASTGSLIISGNVTNDLGGGLDGALVALITVNITSGAFGLAAVEVLDSASNTAGYSLGPVPLSVYSAGAVRLPGGVGSVPGTDPVAFGFLDDNGDGTPDVIFIPSGNDFQITEPAATTAATNYAQALETASSVVADPYLIAVQTTVLQGDGLAPAWIYSFASPSEPGNVDVYQVDLFSVPLAVADDVIGESPLVDPFVDSDAAASAALAAGGAAFIESQQTIMPPMTIRRFISAPAVISGETPRWEVLITSSIDPNSPPAASFLADVNMATGEVIRTVTTDDEDQPQVTGLRLDLVGANPAAGPVEVLVTADRAQPVRIRVVDAVGREVALLHDGPLAAGATPLSWAGGEPAGFYLVVADGAFGRRVLSVTKIGGW